MTCNCMRADHDCEKCHSINEYDIALKVIKEYSETTEWSHLRKVESFEKWCEGKINKEV